MTKVYIVIISDPEDSWIGSVFATRALAYDFAAEHGREVSKGAPKMHLVEEASDESTLLFSTDDEHPYLNRQWIEYDIYEYDVKEALYESI